jgi:hypothetical protein
MTKLPTTFAKLVKLGGPEHFAREESERAARRERTFWLGVLESWAVDNDDWLCRIWIRDLRRRLGIKQPRDLETIRAQTRERVRRFRQRQAAKGLK